MNLFGEFCFFVDQMSVISSFVDSFTSCASGLSFFRRNFIQCRNDFQHVRAERIKREL